MDWVTVGGEESLADSFGVNLEKGNGFVDPSEVGRDAHPSADIAPLLPCGAILLAGKGRKALGYDFPCSIEVSCRLHLDGMVSRCRGIGCEKVDRKCFRKAVSDRCVVREAELAMLFSLLLM